jgi:hypothetical protein
MIVLAKHKHASDMGARTRIGENKNHAMLKKHMATSSANTYGVVFPTLNSVGTREDAYARCLMQLVYAISHEDVLARYKVELHKPWTVWHPYEKQIGAIPQWRLTPDDYLQFKAHLQGGYWLLPVDHWLHVEVMNVLCESG